MEKPQTFDRAAHLRTDLDQLERLLDRPDTLLLPLHQGRVPVAAPNSGLICSLRDYPTVLSQAGELVFLGLLDGQGLFAADVSAVEEGRLGELIGPHQLTDLRLSMAQMPAEQAELYAYGRAMLHFHRSHGFCSRCGAETRARKGGHCRECVACKRETFPRTDGAVLVLVHRDDRILLGRQGTWPRGMYSTLAGFVEAGESLEQTVRREVWEETGIELADVRYQASQPWPFPSSLMLGFVARAVTDTIQLDDELEDARFFGRDELRSPTLPDFFVPGPASLAGRLISAFVDGKLG